MNISGNKYLANKKIIEEPKVAEKRINIIACHPKNIPPNSERKVAKGKEKITQKI